MARRTTDRASFVFTLLYLSQWTGSGRPLRLFSSAWRSAWTTNLTLRPRPQNSAPGSALSRAFETPPPASSIAIRAGRNRAEGGRILAREPEHTASQSCHPSPSWSPSPALSDCAGRPASQGRPWPDPRLAADTQSPPESSKGSGDEGSWPRPISAAPGSLSLVRRSPTSGYSASGLFDPPGRVPPRRAPVPESSNSLLMTPNNGLSFRGGDGFRPSSLAFQNSQPNPPSPIS